ncbi:MAG: hypothetical protein OEZ65_07915 [Gemmatimonadota bacterium]|nr:hypothetical protein [Gemmatimonadota bacterium]MDH5759502.1 hypothetical protein [Gemmatimonadota bacterium]
MNRIRNFTREREDAPRGNDFHVVITVERCFYVEEEVGRKLMRLVRRRWRPRWIRFRTLEGTEVQVLSESVRSIEESTMSARERWRALQRALESEREDGEPIF